MPFSTVVEADKLALLTRVLDSFCDQHGIVDAQDREEAAFQIFHVYDRGIEDEVGLLTIMKAVHWRGKPPAA
jgi:hypothetical protein